MVYTRSQKQRKNAANAQTVALRNQVEQYVSEDLVNDLETLYVSGTIYDVDWECYLCDACVKHSFNVAQWILDIVFGGQTRASLISAEFQRAMNTGNIITMDWLYNTYNSETSIIKWNINSRIVYRDNVMEWLRNHSNINEVETQRTIQSAVKKTDNASSQEHKPQFTYAISQCVLNRFVTLGFDKELREYCSKYKSELNHYDWMPHLKTAFNFESYACVEAILDFMSNTTDWTDHVRDQILAGLFMCVTYDSNLNAMNWMFKECDLNAILKTINDLASNHADEFPSNVREWLMNHRTTVSDTAVSDTSQHEKLNNAKENAVLRVMIIHNSKGKLWLESECFVMYNVDYEGNECWCVLGRGITEFKYWYYSLEQTVNFVKHLVDGQENDVLTTVLYNLTGNWEEEGLDLGKMYEITGDSEPKRRWIGNDSTWPICKTNTIWIADEKCKNFDSNKFSEIVGLLTC